MSDTWDDDLAIVSRQDIYDQFVHVDSESQLEYLQTKWINDMLSCLVKMRHDAGMSQVALAKEMGKIQSTIGRLERGDDIKLSTFFDYAARTGHVPISLPGFQKVEEAIAGIAYRQHPLAAPTKAFWENMRKSTHIWTRKESNAPKAITIQTPSSDDEAHERVREASAA